jgi:hypothetical protein
MKVTVESIVSYACKPIRVKKVIFEDTKITFVFVNDTTYSFPKDYVKSVSIDNDLIGIVTITDKAADLLVEKLHIRKKK